MTPNGPNRKPPASRSSRLPNTLGASNRGAHSQSIAPSGAIRAPVWQSEMKAYSAIGGNGDGAAAVRGPEPDQLVVKLDPSTGIQLLVNAQRSEQRRPEQIGLDMEFAEQGGEGPTPYEVLLHAAMVGNSTRFTRQDAVEETWRIMQPLLDSPPPVHPYAPGSWGPAEEDELVAGHGRWRGPWVVQ